MALNMTTPPTSTTRGSQLNLLGDSITFKVQSKEHSETRLFLLPRQFASFQAVVARIVELFGFQNEQQLQVQYTDDENDLVTITTDEELRSALQLFSGRPSLRLSVSVRKNCSTIQVASEPKAFEVITIEPDHAESVVNCNKFAGDSNTTSSDQPSVTLEEASEKLADFVVPASIDTSPVVGVKEVADEVPTTTISSTRSASDLESSKDCKPAVVIGRDEPKRILTKEERIKMREARLAMKAKRESMAAGLKQLEELGFAAQRGHCIRLLLKYEGDVDQVIQEMKAWAQAKEAREKLKLERQEKKKLKEEYKAKKALVLSQKKELIEEKKKRREMMAERKKLKEDLKQERCLKKAEMLEKKRLMKEQRLLKKKVTNAIGVDEDPAFEEFKPQLAQLEAMGFKCKHRNVRLLKKFDGEVTKVIDLIAFKEAERLQAYAEKHGIAEYEAAHKAAFEKLAELGYDDKRLNVRLLKQFDGDVDKVILHLRIIDEKKRHRAEMAKLLAAAQPQPQLQLPVAHPQQQQQQSVIVN